jgi:lipooligosaccharide transport system ATP-binding protein
VSRPSPTAAAANDDDDDDDAMVSAQGLTRRYGARVAVDGVSFEVRRGECWGLLGPNGAGKTTLLRMLLGKTPADGGRLRVLGHAVPEDAVAMRARVGVVPQKDAMRARVGVVPQKDALDPDFTVAENLRVFGSYFGLPRAAVDARIPGLLSFAALEGRGDAYIGALSGGMQRRLSLSRALVNEPRLLLLDEPTTGLDPQARQLIWQRLRALSRDGLTLVLTTHYMEEAERLCDRVTIMDHGRILDSGAPDVLIARHIESQVVEVHGEGAAAWHRREASRLAARDERVGDTLFYYCHDAGPLLASVDGVAGLRFLHRPANLEDVFLKLTGRELRDA